MQAVLCWSVINPHHQRIFSFSAVTLGSKLSETIRGKLRFGAKVLQAGSIDSLQGILCSRERRETSEDFPVLSFDYSWPNSGNAFHLNREDCLP
jgi:hypothetical protein